MTVERYLLLAYVTGGVWIVVLVGALLAALVVQLIDWRDDQGETRGVGYDVDHERQNLCQHGRTAAAVGDGRLGSVGLPAVIGVGVARHVGQEQHARRDQRQVDDGRNISVPPHSSSPPLKLGPRASSTAQW